MHTQTNLDLTMAALLADWFARPFAWGVVDCCQFARAAAQALHGVHVDAPTYTTERGALRTVRGMGGFAGILQKAGMVPRSLPAARRGDFVLTRSAGLFDRGLALVTGQYAHAPSVSGLMSVSRADWLECWGVA